MVGFSTPSTDKEHLQPVFRGELAKLSTPVPQEYLLNHTVCDFAETVRWWMEHESYTPEEIGSFFFSTTPFA